MKNKRLSPAAAYALGIGSALAVGAVSALISSRGIRGFEELNKPPLSPPGWLFPVAWTALYILMGIGAARVYLAHTDGTKAALAVYAAQLIVNGLWSPIFFAAELRLAAFAWLIILIALSVWMFIRFRRVDRTAALLQIPYLVWLLFAAYLNLGVYLLNG